MICAREALANRGRGVDEARKATIYFTNNALRMDYAAYREAGYQVGSGTAESARKQLGIQCMKVPGATWGLQGARLTAKARCAAQQSVGYPGHEPRIPP